MNARRIAALAVGCLLLTTGPGAAHATPYEEGPTGQPCGVTATTDPTAEAGIRVGEVHGGPLVSLATGTLVCTVRVNGVAGPEARAHGGAPVVVVGPQPVSYAASSGDVVTICTSFEYDLGWTVYRTAGGWTIDPNAPCDPVVDEHGGAAGEAARQYADPLACPVLSQAGGGEGDVWLAGRQIKDCPPYDGDPPPPPPPTDPHLYVDPMPLHGSIVITGEIYDDPWRTDNYTAISWRAYGHLAEPGWTCRDEWDDATGDVRIVCTPQGTLTWDCLGQQATAQVRPYVRLEPVDVNDPEPPLILDDPYWGVVATSARCASGTSTSSATTATAQHNALPWQGAVNTTAVLTLRSVTCTVSGPPRGNFTATCTFP
jgi:hypothetical protein